MESRGMSHEGTGRNGRPPSRIVVPGSVPSQADPPPFGPQDLLREAQGALRFHDAELAVLERIPAQSHEVMALIREHKRSRDRVLAVIGRTYARGAGHMVDKVQKVAQAIEDNFSVAFPDSPPAPAPEVKS